jgi:hypothetical protein
MLSSPLPRFINQLIDDGKGPSFTGTAQAHSIASSSSSSAVGAGMLHLHLEDSVNDLLHAKIEQRTDFLISTADTQQSVSFPPVRMIKSVDQSFSFTKTGQSPCELTSAH